MGKGVEYLKSVEENLFFSGGFKEDDSPSLNFSLPPIFDDYADEEQIECNIDSAIDFNHPPLLENYGERVGFQDQINYIWIDFEEEPVVANFQKPCYVIDEDYEIVMNSKSNRSTNVANKFQICADYYLTDIQVLRNVFGPSKLRGCYFGDLQAHTGAVMFRNLAGLQEQFVKQEGQPSNSLCDFQTKRNAAILRNSTWLQCWLECEVEETVVADCRAPYYTPVLGVGLGFLGYNYEYMVHPKEFRESSHCHLFDWAVTKAGSLCSVCLIYGEGCNASSGLVHGVCCDCWHKVLSEFRGTGGVQLRVSCDSLFGYELVFSNFSSNTKGLWDSFNSGREDRKHKQSQHKLNWSKRSWHTNKLRWCEANEIHLVVKVGLSSLFETIILFALLFGVFIFDPGGLKLQELRTILF